MKNNISVIVIGALIIGLLFGYIVYPFINSSEKQTTQTQDSNTAIQADWTKFENKQYGISFEYPKSWSVEESTQVFENGDLVAVQLIGETQQNNTEFYDGGRFIVMTPVPTDLELDSWVNSKYTANDQISDVTINGVVFKKVYTCGLGCHTYFHTVVNGQAYGINTFAEGSQKAELQAEIDQILQTFLLSQ